MVAAIAGGSNVGIADGFDIDPGHAATSCAWVLRFLTNQHFGGQGFNPVGPELDLNGVWRDDHLLDQQAHDAFLPHWKS